MSAFDRGVEFLTMVRDMEKLRSYPVFGDLSSYADVVGSQSFMELIEFLQTNSQRVDGTPELWVCRIGPQSR
jgi:hypothetical protein